MSEFANFIETKELEKFYVQFTSLCEAIDSSGLTFEQYWDEHAFPVITEGNFSNEDQLLNEFLNKLWNWANRRGIVNDPAYDAQQKAQAAAHNQIGSDLSNLAQTHTPAGNPNFLNQLGARDRARDMRVAQGQDMVNQKVQEVQRKFASSMKGFLTAVSNSAIKSDDRYSWQIAKMFYDKAIKAMQNFAVNVSLGKDQSGFADVRKAAMEPRPMRAVRRKPSPNQQMLPGMTG